MQISIKNLSFSYGEKSVLSHFNLNIRRGERIWIQAPSGFGKTTLLRLICGLETPDEGEIILEEGLRIVPVFQEDRLLPWRSVAGNIRLVLKDMPARDAKEITDEVLSAVGLEEASSKLPAMLSGGMARRVALARAIAAGGDVLVLDEPFVGLDEDIKKRIADYIKLKYDGKTIIIITHDETEAELLSAEKIALS